MIEKKYSLEDYLLGKCYFYQILDLYWSMKEKDWMKLYASEVDRLGGDQSIYAQRGK